MSLCIPIDSAWQTELAARTALKTGHVHWKLEIDPDGLGYHDYTSIILNNQLLVSAKSSIFKPAEATQLSVVLRNSPKVFQEGDLKNAPCRLSVKIGNADYITIFTGFVSSLKDDKKNGIDDKITLTAYDVFKSKGVSRKVRNAALLNYKICDTTNNNSSLLHFLAARMDFLPENIEVSDILSVKDYIGYDNSKTVLQELQDMATINGAFLGIRYDGKLRFLTWTASEWNEAVPEYTFDGNNIHEFSATTQDVAYNVCKTEIDRYKVVGVGVPVYKNYDAWNETFSYNEITVESGKYWMAGTAGGSTEKQVNRCEYGYNGEKYPIGINIITPTIGAVGSGCDIECNGGLISLASFNGSNTDTKQNLNSSEIILYNNTPFTITIRRLQIRGTPLRNTGKEFVESVDTSVAGNEDAKVTQELSGRYGTLISSAQVITKRYTDFGSVQRKIYEVKADFTPHIQCGVIVHFHPTNDRELDCFVQGYKHSSSGPHSQSYTSLILIERIDHSDTATEVPVVIVDNDTHTTETVQTIKETLENVPTLDDVKIIMAGPSYTDVPTVPTVTANGVYRGIQIKWDKQTNLLGFNRYEIQVCDTETGIYHALRFDGVDWDDHTQDYSLWATEMVVHSNIPFGGTEDAPTGTMLWYKVRRITTSEIVSDWSIPVSATSSTINTGEIAEHAITANKIETGFLQAYVANINDTLYIGESGIGASSAGSGTPTDGDATVLIDNNELTVKHYEDGGWVVDTQLGGDGPKGTLPILQARALVKTGALAEYNALTVGVRAPAGAITYPFEGNFLDTSNGTWDWETERENVEFAMYPNRGLYSLTAHKVGAYRGLGLSITGETDTGLSPNFIYDMTVTVDGVAQAISITTGSGTTTYTDLVGLLNAELADFGAYATLTIAGAYGESPISGDLYIISETTNPATSSIDLE